MKTRSRQVLRIIETCFLVSSLVLGAYCGGIAAKARSTERAAVSFGTFQASHRNFAPNRQLDISQHRSQRYHTAGGFEVIGRLEVPSLKLSVPIMADYRTGDLLQGVGHIPGTAVAGGLGTMGLAGHRDTYFRPLKGIRPQMDIRVSDKSGTYHYDVDSTEIVQPEEVQVLDIQNRPGLTLITCYPFNFIGAAPQRFIVHAHLVSALPD